MNTPGIKQQHQIEYTGSMVMFENGEGAIVKHHGSVTIDLHWPLPLLLLLTPTLGVGIPLNV